jgi:1-pyrroline-5-carboxylate dehydrogenase
MKNTVTALPKPANETVLGYAPGSTERKTLLTELQKQSNQVVHIPLIIGGEERTTRETGQCVCPHNHQHILAEYHNAGEQEVRFAIDAALKAKADWQQMPWDDRAAIFLKAAELISTKYRYILNASTMLNQGKNAFQAEIDSACELADFLRFNVHYMHQIYSVQPDLNTKGTWNQLDYRPLEGFVFAVTPFNFTAIAGNLPSTPALMGNTVLWKPASSAVLSGYHIMQLFKEAGLPDGVINFLPGRGCDVGDPVLNSEQLSGVHFTGSTAVFNRIWQTIGRNISSYRTYPRIVGETGGKDFIFVHTSADPDTVITAAVRGAFEYQGQKCSAASRMYVPRSFWNQIRGKLAEILGGIKIGDVTDFTCFMNAVIDESAFDTIMKYIDAAKNSDRSEIIFGGNGDKTKGYFIEPTVILAKDPHFLTMEEEVFGPVLTVYAYDDDAYKKTLAVCDQTSVYGLTGAVMARDRSAIEQASSILRFAAGNLYINDKPTGAVVGQQPFGGSRKSGTNDKAGSYLNLLRWTSPRNIKETFCPDRDYRYPGMG